MSQGPELVASHGCRPQLLLDLGSNGVGLSLHELLGCKEDKSPNGGHDELVQANLGEHSNRAASTTEHVKWAAAFDTAGLDNINAHDFKCLSMLCQAQVQMLSSRVQPGPKSTMEAHDGKT